MNVLEKAEKALEFLKSCDGSTRSHDFQSAAGTLGRCLGALGSRPNYTRHYANLLHSAIPTLLGLASNDSAEIRLVGDEALNRAVAGGFAFHAYKCNIILQNQIEHTKNARWIRAALSRVCLGESWLRPGVGKIRAQAQILFPKLSGIVRQGHELQLVVEALDANLVRILGALAEFTTDEELIELSKALQTHADSSEPAIRRCVASCIARICEHRPVLISSVLDKAFENLWPYTTESNVVLGWFNIIKSMFQLNKMSTFTENNDLTVVDYLELYHLCIHYIEQSTDHNIQNGLMECLSVLLTQASGGFKKALLEKSPRKVDLDGRERVKGHSRNISSTSAITSIMSASLSRAHLEEVSEMSFSGNLHLASLSQMTSVEDLTLHTPDTPTSDHLDIDLQTTDEVKLTKDLTEKLEKIELERQSEPTDVGHQDLGFKVNIGSSFDEDVLLKYCARLLASKFLLTGNKGGVISDRSVRVSVKSSALNCLAEILQLYPQAVTLFIDKEADFKSHNISGSTESSNHDNITEFILERNICYQDSLTDSLTQELNKSIDSQNTFHSKLSKKDSKSLEKSLEKSIEKSMDKSIDKSIEKSMEDSKPLLTSGISADTNMSISNFTSNSNMTGSGYPLSSSGDILSSSIDLDMKFDHFAENFEPKKVLKRTDEVNISVEKVDVCIGTEVFEFQHMSEMFLLLETHGDPQVRGMIRVCIGNYLSSAIDLSHGDYSRWRNITVLAKDVSDNFCAANLVEIVLKGLSDESHSTVNHTLQAIIKISSALSYSTDFMLLSDILTKLSLQDNKYYLCKVNLCHVYKLFNYERLYMLEPDFFNKTSLILDKLLIMLADQDHKVRTAASDALACIVPTINPPKSTNPTAMLLKTALKQTQHFTFETEAESLDLVKEMYFYYDLPDILKKRGCVCEKESLRMFVSEIMERLMQSNCKFYSQGLLEALLETTKRYPPWENKSAYKNQGILEYAVIKLDSCDLNVQLRTILTYICCEVYPVEIHYIMSKKTTNRDIFERDNQAKKFNHLNDENLSNLCEKFQFIVLRSLNVIVHLIEEISPNVQVNKVLPGSPVRRTEESRKRDSETNEEKSRKKTPITITNLRANFAGNFYSEPFYMKLYDNLRATYSNHKINLDPKSSIFYDHLSSVLDALSIQLELSTEREFGTLTEELLYYLKVIMPWRSEKTVNCVTQLLKCLFGTNMVNQFNDFLTLNPKIEQKSKTFFDDVLLINKLGPIIENDDSYVNEKMIKERDMLINIENFSKNKTDRKWSTNKKELEKYIKLFEPVVIQALKSYTMQNDIQLQCSVLTLLNQLLTLRVNYCMLDSDQIFIAFLLKQLELVEQREIPNCSDLVSNIMLFLVQLSSSKHNRKQIIEIPKLIQLCDGLLASGATKECVLAMSPLAVKVFTRWSLGLAPQRELAATREVVCYMLHKCLSVHEVINLISCVLALSQDNPESYLRWCSVSADCWLALLAQRSAALGTREAVTTTGRHVDLIHRSVLLEQKRVEMALKILFQSPPEQSTAPYEEKNTYLTTAMILLRKILVLVPESEILLSINYLKSTYISPQSIFFNVKTEIDPLNVQNVNENCANLSPDVILVRFLFRLLTYVILEVDSCNEVECSNLDNESGEHKLLYSVCVALICQVKNMLHLTDNCLFPLTSKTAQNILHNEQSGLNTGLYSPEENIPLELLNLICLRSSHRIPLLTVHWSHLLIRLKFLEQKYWQNLLGFVRNLPLNADNTDSCLLQANLLQVGCFMAYCEYFVENGLSEAVHLTWLLVNRVHLIISRYSEPVVRELVAAVHLNPSASGLLLQAVAARCRGCLKGEFALNTYKILKDCHVSQSGALIFFICRVIGKLEPSVAARFACLAIQRCTLLKELPSSDINTQLSKEDVQVALELLQRDKVHIRYKQLVKSLNGLASTVFDLSPLDLANDRTVNPHSVACQTVIDSEWLVKQVSSRCSLSTTSAPPKIKRNHELALLISKLSKDEMTAVISNQDFDRTILSSCFKVSTENYLKELLKEVSKWENKEIEKENFRKQSRKVYKEETTVDSNKMTVSNPIHVFKKSDNKESKSQFFIPINEIEKIPKLQIVDDENDINPPTIPDLYVTAVVTFDKSLTEVARQFPKQSRPMSQSENFNLSIETTIDRYTKRCHQVFQDKLFYQEYNVLQNVLTGYLQSLSQMKSIFDEIDSDIYDKCQESILPKNLAKNIAVFCVISLQYLSFLIKNKKIVESPVNTDVSFRVTSVVTEKVVIDKVVKLTLDNVSKALKVKEIWCQLDNDSNVNRKQSAISCFYATVKYLVKDTKPLVLKHYIQTEEPKTDMIIICEKLLTLIEYWEDNIYSRDIEVKNVLGVECRQSVEDALVCLARLECVWCAGLVPGAAWGGAQAAKQLPLQPLQDLDVLAPFLFRVNLIGWTSKKQFEEIWVALLNALQGNGAHLAIRGMMQLLLSTVTPAHAPRRYCRVSEGMQLLRNILIGTSLYSEEFTDVNLERIPLIKDSDCLYHCGQFSTEFLKLAAEVSDDAPYQAKVLLKRVKKNTEIDVNSCIQLLMDVATQMLEPKAPTGLAARAALLDCLTAISSLFTSIQSWERFARLVTSHGLAHAPALSACLTILPTGQQELTSVHQKLLSSLSSSNAAARAAALRGRLLLAARLPHDPGLLPSRRAANRISLYEQSLYWAMLFTLLERGQPELMTEAVDFLLKNPTHYCADLVVKGITSMIRQQVLPKDLKNTTISRLLDNMAKYQETHAVQILMVHLFSADTKLLSPKTSSVMDPDVLMNSMERLALLYKVYKQCHEKENREIVIGAIGHIVRESAPAEALSRAVIEFLQNCEDSRAEGAGGVVVEVFETAVQQNQLSVLSGWIFETLIHLVQGKITPRMLPYCLTLLLVAASPNRCIRSIAPLCIMNLRLGYDNKHLKVGICEKDEFEIPLKVKNDDFVNKNDNFVNKNDNFVNKNDNFVNIVEDDCNDYFSVFLKDDHRISYSDKRLLCVVAMHSGFSKSQLGKLKELCEENECLVDLYNCLTVE